MERRPIAIVPTLGRAGSRAGALRGAAATAVLALAVAGCGGGGGSSSSETTSSAATTPAATVGGGTSTQQQTTGGGGGASDAQVAAGKKVFTDSGCGSCHTLKDAGTTGHVGPNLDELQPAQDAVAAQVKSGGGGMPSFSGRLTDQQIQAVAAYVAGVAGQ
ncbi:MAG TPA: cytochrome c [Baekduia sp.]|nr:cytochrome c [Baekduia sp.]